MIFYSAAINGIDGLISWKKDLFNGNRLNKKIYMINFIGAEKIFDETQDAVLIFK